MMKNVPLVVVPFREVVSAGNVADRSGVVNHSAIRRRKISPIVPIAPKLPVVLNGRAEPVRIFVPVTGIEIDGIYNVAMEKFVRGTVRCPNGPNRRCGTEIFARKSYGNKRMLARPHRDAIHACFAPFAQYVDR